MSGRKLLFLFILLLSCHVYGRDKTAFIDSIRHKLSAAPQKDKAALYLAVAEAYSKQSGDSSMVYAQKAVALAVQHKDKRTEGGALAQIGIVYKNRGNYENALNYHLKSLEIAEYLKDDKALAARYNNIGIVYKKMRRWNEALGYYQKANTAARKANDLSRVSLTYNNIATIYLDTEEWDLVLPNYDSARKYADLSGDVNAKTTVLANMGDLYREWGKYVKAIDVTQECLHYDKMNRDKYGMFMTYFLLARIYSELKDYQQWQLYSDSAETIGRQEGLNRELVDLLNWKSTMSLLRKDTSAAFAYYQQARGINDSLLNETTANRVSELQTKYETEKKEQKIALQQSELGRKNIIIVSICIMMLLILVLTYSFYNRYKLKQQARLQQAVMREQEMATQAVIAAEENERKRIAGDLHDGVGQLMSAARMNLSLVANEVNFDNEEQKTAFDKALSLVDDSCKEVRAVSHNIMPNALLKAGLASAIRDFLHKIDHRVLEVNLYADGMNERLPSNIEMVLYRVVQECVNNVIKHSGASKLDITLIKDEEGISITVEDNGKGFNLDEKQDDDTGIGLKNMQTRIHYLKGTIEWDTAPGKGTVVVINVPNDK